MRKLFLRLGSLLALIAVALGAFGAHGLEGKIPVEHLHNFETGVRYQMYHAIAILVIALLLHFSKKPILITAAWFFVAGIALFSGSLYLLALRSVFALPVSVLGPITPIGGLCQLTGWALLFFSSFTTGIKKSAEE